MYLAPWQIFAMGCVCGVFISAVIIVIALLRLAFKSGVRIEKEERGKDNK